MNTFFIACLLLVNLSEPVAPTSNKKPDEPTTPVVPIHTPAKSKSYWVIHQITGDSEKVLVLYYNNRNELVKKEWRKLEIADTDKPRVIRLLKKALNEANSIQGEENWN